MRQKHEYYVDYDEPSGTLTSDLVSRVYDRCRRDFMQPGFVLVNLPAILESRQLRRWMVGLKQELETIHRVKTGRRLVYTSMGRFNQHVTTKPHRDGGPDESVLMLGYEPTSVHSRLYMADYSDCAFDLGMEPRSYCRLTTQCTPMASDYSVITQHFLKASIRRTTSS